MSGRRYTLEVKDPRAPDRFVLRHDVAAGTIGLTVAFPAERSFELVVTDGAGTPVDPQHVWVVEESGFVSRPRCRPRAPGTLEVQAPTVPFSLQVVAPGYRPQRLGPFALDALPERVSARLAAASAIRGRVLVDGVPAAGASVHLHRVPADDAVVRFAGGLPSRLEGPLGRAVATTDASGAFELFVPTAGRWVVHAEVEGRAMAESGDLRVEEGRSIDDVELACAPAATLEGNVLCAAGVDAEGMLVAITRGDGHVRFQVVASDGSFRFTGLAAGEWQVRRCEPEDQQWLREGRTWPDAPVGASSTGVVLFPGQTARFDLDLRAELPAVLRGRLTLGARPARGFRATLRQERTQVTGTTDASGRFELRARQPGRAWLSLSAHLAGGELEVRRRVELAAGDNVCDLALAAGAVEVSGLAPPAEPHREAIVPGYALTWDRVGEQVDGVRCLFRFDPLDGSLVAHGLPAGTAALRRRPARAAGGTDDWPVQQTLRIEAGTRTRLVLPPK
jgi:hypothetical protein